MFRKEVKFNYTNALVGGIFLILGLIALFWLAKGIFTILAWVSPILLIATLIIDYRTVLRYGKWILNQFKSNPLMGVAVSIFTVIGFPIVSFFLFGKAMFRRKIKSLENAYTAERSDSYTDYEIVEEKPVSTLELPPLEKRKKAASGDYEQLFD